MGFDYIGFEIDEFYYGEKKNECQNIWRKYDLIFKREDMKIIRVFPTKTSYTPIDDYVFIGMPPFIIPEHDEIHISCTFTWDRDYCEFYNTSGRAELINR